MKSETTTSSESQALRNGADKRGGTLHKLHAAIVGGSALTRTPLLMLLGLSMNLIGSGCDDHVSDSDGDNVSDRVDNCPTKNNRSQEDLDNDGIGDDCDDDSDGDGVPNNKDNCNSEWRFESHLNFNPSQMNGDGDRYGDACDRYPEDYDNDGVAEEQIFCALYPLDDPNDTSMSELTPWFIYDNCPHLQNEEQRDQDGDNIGDDCDNDRDGDGVENEQDNCDHERYGELSINFNPDQKDTDGDERGDICDRDPKNKDNDGIDKSKDNCPEVWNRYQKDLDRDGTGNECDDDIDGDGIKNDNADWGYNALDSREDGHNCVILEYYPDNRDIHSSRFDNCPYILNPEQTDTDKDGKGDACDNNRKKEVVYYDDWTFHCYWK